MDLTNATWRKASRSSNNGGNCVESVRISGTVAIRDSKDPYGPALLLTPRALRRLAAALRND
ncbi:hypothetical protein amrb99_18040 [Actinomadura sp. RB99]|uniref:DUF397 domain-containing protein n=1 Tax=Actinomadura sp. RB99 TaxID=2691577 RepID=UPI001689E217|nr:DUF397 domain-containing protein [Actinomadura sp. RB99]MBD2892884.1 hypothetical protein [Actinomadura sp. RB99]